MVTSLLPGSSIFRAHILKVLYPAKLNGVAAEKTTVLDYNYYFKQARISTGPSC
jgi:hypothetical protein